MRVHINIKRKDIGKLFKSVENLDWEEIFWLLNIDKEDVYNYTFESGSFIIGMKDKKTLIEFCVDPESIDIYQEENNPLFNY